MMGSRAITGLVLVFGIIVLVALVWMLGPSLDIGGAAPLRDPGARLLVTIALVAISLAVFGTITLLSRQRDAVMMRGLVEPAPQQARNTAALKPRRSSDRRVSIRQGGLLRELDHVLALLRRHRFAGGSRRGIYQVPWYLVLGPRGAGKSDLIDNLGLTDAVDEPPHAQEGWRWLLAEEAVLLDLNGQFLVDRDGGREHAVWSDLLDRLRRRRRRQPLDGILLVFALPDLVTRTAGQRAELARAIRRRLQELGEKLHQALPVYVVLSQADRILGFREFFLGLDTEDRQSVWGHTFPAEAWEAAQLKAGLSEAFTGLVRRLDMRLLDRLQRERDPLRRGRAFAFPRQIATLSPILSDFLQAVFQPSRFASAPRLRGFYLASARQHGIAEDITLTRGLKRFAIASATPIEEVDSQRPFFLGRLFDGVILPERGWGIGKSKPLDAIARIAAAAVLVAVAIALIPVFFSAARIARDSAVAGETAAAHYQQALERLDLTKIGNSDPHQAAAALAALDALQARLHTLADASPLPVALFAPQAPVATAGADAYEAQLDRLLLPRLLLQIEAAMRADLGSPATLETVLPIYLGLGNRGPLDRAATKQWFAMQWNAAFPGQANAPLRTELDRALGALLTRPLATFPLDPSLVDDARRVIAAGNAGHAELQPVGHGHAV